MQNWWKLLTGVARLQSLFIEGADAGTGAGGGDTGAAAGGAGDAGGGGGSGTAAGGGAGDGGAGGGGAAAAAVSNPADNPREFLRTAVSKVQIPEAGAAKPAAEAAKPAAAVTAEADKKPEVKPGEQPQPKTEAELEAEKQAAEKAKQDAEKTTADPPNPLDKLGPLPAEKLAEALKANPELDAALEKAGIDKETLFETSRRAAMTDQFLEHFPTPEHAKFARESAEHFYDIEDRFPKIQSTQDLDKFISDTMVPLSIVYGPDGKPQMNPDGKTFKTDGSVARFVQLIGDFDQGMSKGLADSIIEQGTRAGGDQGEAIKEYGERLKSALTLVEEFRAAGYKMPVAKQSTAELSPEQKAEMERLRKVEQESTARTTQEQERQTSAFETSLFTDATEDSEKFLRATVDATSLTDNEKRHAIADIYEEVAKRMEADRTFQQLKTQLWNQGLSDKTRAEIRALNKRTFQVYATKVMDKVLNEAGAKRIQQNADRQKKIDTQIDQDRARGTGGTSAGTGNVPRVESADDLHNKAVSGLTKELGRAPRDQEIFNRVLELKGLRQKSA